MKNKKNVPLKISYTLLVVFTPHFGDHYIRQSSQLKIIIMRSYLKRYCIQALLEQEKSCFKNTLFKTV